jgi:hypothetical protein
MSAAGSLFEPLEPIPPQNPVGELKQNVSDVRKARNLVKKIINNQPLI